MRHETRGRKEVAEAVVQAALVAAVTALANWGVDALKEAHRKRQETAATQKLAANAEKGGEI